MRGPRPVQLPDSHNMSKVRFLPRSIIKFNCLGHQMQKLLIVFTLLLAVNGADAPKDCAPGHPKGMNGPCQPK